MAAEWIVVRTKPNSERWAALNVKRQGRESYFPQTFDKKRLIRRPLFPNYLFVRLQCPSFSWLRGTFGVANVLMFGQRPATISMKVIRELRSRENAHGVISLEDPFDLLQHGDTVRVKAGSLQDRLVIYQGMSGQSRCRILLEMLGQQTSTTIDRALIEPKALH